MRRRTLLQWVAAVLPALPYARVRLAAQTRTLTPEALVTLEEVGETVLPASIGADQRRQAVRRFAAWVEGYEEGVPVSHGYGHPRLVRTPASPAPDYVAQLASLQAAARRRGAAFGALPLETRRALLDAAFTDAGVRDLPRRPDGKHVAADLMAHYFRSSAANDQAYRALIARHTCKPIQIQTRRPQPLNG
ncbi:MAG: hypothetical protein AB7O67_05990 [Vicinamibacterales bacterium]